MLIQILLYPPPSLPSQPYCIAIGDVPNMLLATTQFHWPYMTPAAACNVLSSPLKTVARKAEKNECGEARRDLSQAIYGVSAAIGPTLLAAQDANGWPCNILSSPLQQALGRSNESSWGGSTSRPAILAALPRLQTLLIRVAQGKGPSYTVPKPQSRRTEKQGAQLPVQQWGFPPLP